MCSIFILDQFYVTHLNAMQHEFIFTHLKTLSGYLLILESFETSL